MDDIIQEAKLFLEQYFFEKKLPGVQKRIQEVVSEIHETGTYRHTFKELSYGAKMAWRNSNRCIGRLFWRSLQLIDARDLTQPEEIFRAVQNHLTTAYNHGKIKPLITIFPPKTPDGRIPVQLRNHQLTSYAGYATHQGIVGDPKMVAFTEECLAMGWKGKGTPFDLLPLVIEINQKTRHLFTLESNQIHEIPITHPDYSWFADLGIKWYAVPAISNMSLLIGGIEYPAAPFNGWYMVTEIASRNLGEQNRYNLLPIIAQKLELAINKDSKFWKDRAILELNKAVYHSYKSAGVTLVDHHTASEEFMKFMKMEQKNNRRVTAEWSWIVPPLSGSALEVFHQEYEDIFLTPNFIYR